MTDRELCDIIEHVRVQCSQNTNATYSLGGIYALDIVKPLLRERLLAEVSSPAPPRPTAGDLMLSALDRWGEHAEACELDDCGECDARINQFRLARKVWNASSHKSLAASPAPPRLERIGQSADEAMAAPACPRCNGLGSLDEPHLSGGTCAVCKGSGLAVSAAPPAGEEKTSEKTKI